MQIRLVSIHATRMGGDIILQVLILFGVGVSIHATRMGGDGTGVDHLASLVAQFLSTPPVWVATQGFTQQQAPVYMFLSTPPVWVAT